MEEALEQANELSKPQLELSFEEGMELWEDALNALGLTATIIEQSDSEFIVDILPSAENILSLSRNQVGLRLVLATNPNRTQVLWTWSATGGAFGGFSGRHEFVNVALANRIIPLSTSNHFGNMSLNGTTNVPTGGRGIEISINVVGAASVAGVPFPIALMSSPFIGG
ncbi:MAG: hypothetical protein FWF59_00595 [Turicibacter sp.]|nr:hypothetical protein [Turicibacter sp.]